MHDAVGEARVLTIDGECVDDARSYESVVARLAALSGGALVYDRIDCVEQLDGRRLTLRRGDLLVGGVLAKGDWIDAPGLLAVLNDAVADGPGRFVTFESGYGDQSSSFAFLTRDDAGKLRGAVDIEGVKTAWKPRPRGAVPLFVHDAPGYTVASLAASHDGRLIASAGGDEVRVFDTRADITRVVPVAGASAVAFDAHGDVLVGTAAGVHRGGSTLGRRLVKRLVVDRDGKRLVVGAIAHADYDPPQWVEVWDLDSGEWEVATGTINLAAAGDTIATAGEGGECSDGSELSRHRAQAVWALAFGGDGALSVSGDGVTVLAPARKPLVLPEDIAEVGDHVWLPDGTIAVATRKRQQRHDRIYQLSP